jgi:hypothetical protein
MTEPEKHVGTLDFFLRLAERFGVPVLILIAVLWMARDVAVSLHSTVVVPVVSAHTKFLETTQETLKEIGHTQDKQAETLQELATGQQEIRSVLIVRPKDSATN